MRLLTNLGSTTSDKRAVRVGGPRMPGPECQHDISVATRLHELFTGAGARTQTLALEVAE